MHAVKSSQGGPEAEAQTLHVTLADVVQTLLGSGVDQRFIRVTSALLGLVRDVE
jgi:hypothetical protein